MVVVAAILRMVHLGDRPMHHDESLDAWWSWRLGNGEPYSYDPVYHGPLRFYLTAGLYQLFGESEATARLLAAACGTALVALAAATRRWLGNIGSIVAVAVLALSPSMLYFSRFGREDMPFALIELSLVVLIVAWLRRPAPWHPPLMGALVAAAFATKETSFIVVAILGSYLAVLMGRELLDKRRGRTTPQDRQAWSAFVAPGGRALALGALTFGFTFALLFSVGFTDLDGIRAGALDGIRYWLSQQPVNRGSQPWPFYLVILIAHEWPVLVLAGAGSVVAVKRFDAVRGLLLWNAVANLAIYSWASERFPWLVVHPLLALILLAGVGAEFLYRWAARSFDRGVETATVMAGAVLACVLLILAVPAVYRAPDSPHHLLSAVQTSPEMLLILERIEARFAIAPPGQPPRVIIDTRQSMAWPWAWYLRDLPVAFVDLGEDPDAVIGADVVIAFHDDSGVLPAPPSGWSEVTPFAHRSWWLPPWDDAGVADWFGWFTTRSAFGDMGDLNAVELVAGRGW